MWLTGGVREGYNDGMKNIFKSLVGIFWLIFIAILITASFNGSISYKIGSILSMISFAIAVSVIILSPFVLMRYIKEMNKKNEFHTTAFWLKNLRIPFFVFLSVVLEF